MSASLALAPSRALVAARPLLRTVGERLALLRAVELVSREIARESPFRHRHAAALALGGRLVSSGVNRRLSAWRTIHAEVDTLRGVHPVFFSRPGDLTLVVLSLTHGGRLRNSRPCSSCEAVVREAGLGRVVYSVHDGLAVLEDPE